MFHSVPLRSESVKMERLRRNDRILVPGHGAEPTLRKESFGQEGNRTFPRFFSFFRTVVVTTPTKAETGVYRCKPLFFHNYFIA